MIKTQTDSSLSSELKIVCVLYLQSYYQLFPDYQIAQS